jgi:hypothetical protein
MNTVFANNLGDFWFVARTKMVMVLRYTLVCPAIKESCVSKYNMSAPDGELTLVISLD